jgi:hypothetical protein
MIASRLRRAPFAVVGALLLVAAAAPVVAQGPGNNGIVSSPGSANPSAPQGPVPLLGPWHQFGFTAAGVAATGCAPADPAGPPCGPSSAGNSVFADAPPWTFTAGVSGAELTVTDAFIIGDEFEVLDFGVPIGFTPVVADSGSCGDDPDVCVADPLVSHRVYALAAGDHSITITPTDSPFGSGAAYFRVDGEIFVQEIPTLAPAGIVALIGALALVAFVLLRRSRAAQR